MTVLPEHQSLTQLATDEERRRAGDLLRAAYEEGRLAAADFDRRAGIAALAVTRRDLNTAFLGLVEVRQDVVRRYTQPAATSGRGLAVAAYVSGLFFFPVGPLVCFAIAGPGTFARREAAKAFNISFLALIGFVLSVLFAAAGGAVGGLTFLLVGACWFLTTLVGAVQAGQGLDWRHPLKRHVPWEVLREG